MFFDGEFLAINDLKVGDLINDKATISTSLLRDSAYFQNSMILEILAPVGTKGVYMEPYFQGYAQQEFLLSRNTVLKVISEPQFDKTIGKWIIKLEVVSQNIDTLSLGGIKA